MELIEVAKVVRGSEGHILVVAHSQTALTRGLEPGESLVLRAGEEYYAAKVRDYDFEPEDTLYVLDVGGRLPAEIARERIAGLSPDASDAELHEVVDLLGELRQNPPPESPLQARRPLEFV